MTSFTTATTNYPTGANTALRRVIAKRSPTANDKRNFNLGDEWLNEIANQWWKLAELNNITGALWVLFSAQGTGIIALTGNSGGAVNADMAMNINVVGTTPINIVGTPLTNTLTVGSDGTLAINYLEDSGSATASSGNLNVVGGAGIVTSGSGATITIDTSALVATTFQEDVGTASASGSILKIFGGTGVDTVGSGNIVTINASANVPTTFVEDSGSAIPVGNTLNVIGGSGISTSGAGDTITITALAPTNLTFTENTGTATPAANNLNILGTATNGITTSGATDTVTVGFQSPYADGDFEFRSTSSGALRTLLTSNTSNTAASRAVIDVSVAGTSAGDPWFQSTVGTSRSFAIGASNANSQHLRINTNNSGAVSPSTGTNLWDMTPAGIRTMPLQPAFQAGLSVAQNSVTGDGTYYTVQFPVVIYDTQGNFNSGTGVFTAPATGIYLFNIDISSNGYNASHVLMFVDIVANGTIYRGSNCSGAAVRNSANGVELPFSAQIPLTSGQTCFAKIQVSGGTKIINVLMGSTFSGVLLF